jgi:hypothetical protein
MLANGNAAPLIDVVGYRIGRAPAIYECDDGIHRTVAAREAGCKIKARIKGYHQLQPKRFIILRGNLWHPDPSHPGWLQQIVAVNEDMRPVLHTLGVAEWQEPY